MTRPALTATEALLAQAAATTPAEHLTARLALIESGAPILRPLDTTALVAGDGTAGRHLLGGARVDARVNDRQTVASRSGAITGRFHAEHPQARDDEEVA